MRHCSEPVGWYKLIEDKWWCSDSPEHIQKWGPFETEEQARQMLMEYLVNARFSLGESGEY